MKKLLVVLVVLAFASFANAAIIGFNCDDDGDGAIVMQPGTLTNGGYENEVPVYTLGIDCVQSSAPGHIAGDFITDTELDPIVWILQDVENDTNFAWTDYHIAIGMTKSFTISNIVAPDNWTSAITGPISGQLLPNGQTGWLGFVDYYVGSGAPIAIGETGTFGFKTAFAGGVAFCTEQYPTPEPATMSLLGLGALLLRRRSA